MRAQILYDLREKYEFCDGKELHDFFRKELGDPSPRGHHEVNGDHAVSFVSKQLKDMAHNSPSLQEYCEKVRRFVRGGGCTRERTEFWPDFQE